MLGLTLAKRLAEHGQRVTILEAAPTLGGLASPWKLGDITWDRHYHVTLLSDTHNRAFLAELGLEKEMRWVETKTGFFTNEKLVSMSNSWEFLNFPPLNFIEKIRLGATIFYASRIHDWRSLEQVPVTEWLEKFSGTGTFQKIWQPLLRAKLGEAYKKTSAAFIWASIQRMYKARRTGMKKEMFGYLPGGYARILDRAAEVLTDLGVDIRLSQPVARVLSTDAGHVEVTTTDDEIHNFDRLVFTTPSSVIANVCPQMAGDELHRHQQVEYLGIICASVLLRKPLSKYYVTNITDSSIPLTGVIEMTTIVDPDELGGHSLVYLPKYITADDPAWEWTDDEVREKFLAPLDRMYPEFSRDDIVAFRVSRVRHVMAIPTLNYSQHLPPTVSDLPGVFTINSAQIVKGNLNVNETIELAENSFKKVLLPLLSRQISAKPQAATRGLATNFSE